MRRDEEPVTEELSGGNVWGIQNSKGKIQKESTQSRSRKGAKPQRRVPALDLPTPTNLGAG